MNDLTIQLSVDQSPTEVFKAIQDVKSWWIGDVKGDARHVGSKFTYAYKDFHQSSQTVSELVPNQKIVWHVDDATLKFTKDQHEWAGTDIVFEIRPKGNGSEIVFTHRGLTPEVECFEACTGGWTFYVTKSLKNFLTKGKGLDPGF